MYAVPFNSTNQVGSLSSFDCGSSYGSGCAESGGDRADGQSALSSVEKEMACASSTIEGAVQRLYGLQQMQEKRAATFAAAASASVSSLQLL